MFSLGGGDLNETQNLLVYFTLKANAEIPPSPYILILDHKITQIINNKLRQRMQDSFYSPPTPQSNTQHFEFSVGQVPIPQATNWCSNAPLLRALEHTRGK